MSLPDEDLLRPTLAAEFDVTRFQSPWNPAQLRYVAFFAWPLGAGVMYSMNYRRLARERAARITLAGAILAFLGLLVAFWVIAGRPDGLSDRQTVSEFRLACMAVFMVSAIALSRDQSSAFRAYSMAGGKPAPIGGAAVVAVVLNLVVFAGALMAIATLRALGGSP